MDGEADGQGGAVLTEGEKQAAEAALDTARRAVDVDTPPVLTADDDSADEPGEEAEPGVSGLLEEDPAAWELAADSPSASAVSRAPAAELQTAEAGALLRAAAALLDAGLSLAAAGLALLVSELLWLRSEGAVSAPVWVPVLVFFAAGWTHTLAGEGLCAGVTAGKRALGLRVVGADGAEPALWRVAARRACLDALVLAVTVLALWLTMVRQYGGLPPGTPVEMDGSDVAIFCAFFVNLLVLLALGCCFDPQRRFPHDRLAGLGVVRSGDGVVQVGAAAGSGGRRVAAPVGAVRSRWDDETAEVAPARPWDGQRWRPDPAAAAAAEECRWERLGPVSRWIERVVAWGQGTEPAVSAQDASAGVKEVRWSGEGRRIGIVNVVNRIADRVVAWSEGETRRSSGGGEKGQGD